ncbi:MAG: enoyl-CoA hydratase/isomerase family protein [Ignavibacteria bacterium]|nr:enoyl-CoA hydratase/isomerase family protein [Ignavibacteria bacterium]MBT8383026.1 enoyl-CoA hydratase/isomerase family protein [Ignavibacteria bacterium]MBT8391850.1 enoyl-CoA hydratase/isomerase family protein [Ignavibacteria bacterium]NNJ53982.1 enoyl-CoA hydratase [Ignavibacteriaceae bacterium]NNL21483.1 enoyl-CoA hydratase [Ignavibacteriaceae bacterium]
MKYNNLLIEIKEHTAVVTVNRPDKLNALNADTINDLEGAFTELKNKDDVFVIILTGSGEKAFVAGADISELSTLDVLGAKQFSDRGNSVFEFIENLDKPVIAAVNGFALGGGCELALACHIRVSGENAKFGQPEVNLGLIPGYGGTQRLARTVNSARALEYILTGDMINAEEAFRIGLVNRVYPQTELMNKTFELADKIAGKGQQAVRLALKSVRATHQMALTQGLKYEASLFALVCGTEDFKEGTMAFLEKRKPDFKNK